MADENPNSNARSQKNSQEVGAPDFILFLILILLIMGNTKTFNTYFQLVNNHISTITQILEAFNTTVNGLKGAFEAPQKLE